jgi:hypothetical protein
MAEEVPIPMNQAHSPHAMNAPGPFYVLDGCCTACDVPFVEAPGLFSYDKENHCYVKRQPGTKQELNQMLRATWAAELQCIRYRGNDNEILRRMAELGNRSLCDIAPPATIQPVFRNIVTFDVLLSVSESITPSSLGVAFQEYLRSQKGDWISYRFTTAAGGEKAVSFSYSWFEDDFHLVKISSMDLPGCQWLIQHSLDEKAGPQGVSNDLDDWLKKDGRFCNVRWYSQSQWSGSKQWQETPL